LFKFGRKVLKTGKKMNSFEEPTTQELQLALDMKKSKGFGNEAKSNENISVHAYEAELN
jgi:hypothetical protein